MILKSMIKEIVPQEMLDIRKDIKLIHQIKRHKNMSINEAKLWLNKEYEKRVGRSLNIDSPTTFTEKLQWCKLHAMTEEKARLSDKVDVRDWVEKKIGNQYLIPLLGVWEDPSEINFDMLPSSFVIKTNNASATNIIVKDKAMLNYRRTRRQLRRWLNIEYGWKSFELMYLMIPPKIIAEKMMMNDDGSEIADYKFLCFSGEPEYIWVTQNRHTNKTEATLDTGWNFAPWRDELTPAPQELPKKPECFELLLSLVRQLARGFAQVRVDFYVVNNHPYFGEMTFSSGSGFFKVSPLEYDIRIGDLWDLSLEERNDYPYFAD